jgi:segregation and condensation protein B
VLEAALFAAGRPLSLEVLQDLFQEEGGPPPSRDLLRQSLQDLAGEYATRAVQLREVASGYRFQVSPEYARWVARLWAERPARYSRALLETLAIIAYRQPVTRAEVEDIRGVQVSTSVLKTLLERAWVRVVGHRDVPGRPALYGTTREFLDHFNLKTLAELPTLAEVRELDALGRDLFAPATEPAAE